MYHTRHFGGVLKKEDIIYKLKNHTLFKNVEHSVLISALDFDGTDVKTFKSGDEIFSPKNEEKRLGFILVGEANVYSADGNHTVMLRSLNEGDTFGVSNLFDENSRFVSLIVAKKASSVIFFTPEAIGRLLDDSSEFRMSYIKFLSERICFLNKKISCFTAGSPERRLAVFLCSQSSEQTFTVSINANSLSEMLNIGRASLYRAFDKLIADGFIQKTGKNITLINRTDLESNYID